MENYIEMPHLEGISEEGIKNLREIVPNFDFGGFVKELTAGENIFLPEKIFNLIIKVFADELYSAIKILSAIVCIVIISSLLENLYTSFGKRNNNAGFITIALVIGLAVELFSKMSTYAGKLSMDLTNFMVGLLPAMITLTAGSGFVNTGVIAHPVLYFMCNFFSVLFNKVLIPMTVIYLAISMVDLMSDTIELGKFSELIKKVYNFILGIVMTIFTGLLSIASFSGVSLDSVGAKGARFALSTMVPFVGRSISDAMSAVASASLVLKNAVGLTGIVVMLSLCIFPVIKIAAVTMCIRISAAICEPIANKKTIQILSVVGDSLSMINASVISTVVMMIISIGIIMGLGK